MSTRVIGWLCEAFIHPYCFIDRCSSFLGTALPGLSNPMLIQLCVHFDMAKAFTIGNIFPLCWNTTLVQIQIPSAWEVSILVTSLGHGRRTACAASAHSDRGGVMTPCCARLQGSSKWTMQLLDLLKSLMKILQFSAVIMSVILCYSLVSSWRHHSGRLPISAGLPTRWSFSSHFLRRTRVCCSRHCHCQCYCMKHETVQIGVWTYWTPTS